MNSLLSLINQQFIVTEKHSKDKKPRSSLSATKKVKFADQLFSPIEDPKLTNKPPSKPQTTDQSSNPFANNFTPNMLPHLAGCQNFNPQMFYGNPNMMQGNFQPEHPVYFHNFMMQNQMGPFPGNHNPNFCLMMAGQQQQNMSRMQQTQQQGSGYEGVNINNLLGKQVKVAKGAKTEAEEGESSRKSSESIILDDCEYKKYLENSDTDYIPSDSDVEVNAKTQTTNCAFESCDVDARRKRKSLLSS